MKCNKMLICAVCTIIAVGAAVTAIVLFRNEIADFVVEIMDKVDIKRFRRNKEYADFADM